MSEKKDKQQPDGHHCNDDTCRGYFDAVYQEIKPKIGWPVFSLFVLLIMGMVGGSFGYTYDMGKESRTADKELSEKISELSEKIGKLADKDDLKEWKDDIKELIEQIKE